MACTIESQDRCTASRHRSVLGVLSIGTRQQDGLSRHRRPAWGGALALGETALALLLAALLAVAAPPTDAGADPAEAVRAAVIMANGLERSYWEDPSAFSGWDAVYAHFRRGYSAEIAERMTEFTLDNDGDMATWVPDEVQVVEVGERSALAYFDTPPEFGPNGLWGFAAYMVVRLTREDGRWVIDWATDSETPPPASQ
jgi:hypothetical protein